jgi:predicted lipoprotein with Yx(FWY)xxD motif
MRNQTAIIIGAVGIGLVVGACSSGSSTTSSSPAVTSPASSKAAAAPATTQAGSPAAAGQASGTATVSLAAISGIPGKALVGGNGRTMYLFEGDKSGTSACSSACAAVWPPVTVSGTPKAGSGVNQALLVTIKRPDGTMQLVYHGHPLYYYTGDTAAGTARGQGAKAFGSDWYVVNASGSKIDND